MKNYNSNTPISEKDCAQTPPWFIASLEDLMAKEFDLDACALPQTAKAEKFYSLENDQNGLELPWAPLTWCNPPFSDIQPWLEKAWREAEYDGNTTCVIMPDNTETGYSRYALEKADTIIRMPFRLQFLRPDGTRFLDKKGKPQSPQFPCQVAIFTALGNYAPTRQFYHDFRVGFYGN